MTQVDSDDASKLKKSRIESAKTDLTKCMFSGKDDRLDSKLGRSLANVSRLQRAKC
jgi:hypothetical protein